MAPVFVSGCTTTVEAEIPTEDEQGQEMNVPETELVVYSNEEGEAVCPVMDNVISEVEFAKGHQDYEGVRYYFYCDGCPEAFAARNKSKM